MKVGITLPQFGSDIGAVRAAVRAAERAGLDGVFVFDHLWPIGRPDGQVLHSTPLLGFVCALTSRLAVGTLVARVGVVPDAVLVSQFATAQRMIGPRLIAGVGTGDRLSAAENRAYGLPYPPARERLAQLAAVLDQLAAAGVTTWAGGRSAGLRRVAAAHAGALNVWGADLEQVGAEGADVAARAEAHDRAVDVTWGGQVLIGRDEQDAADRLARHGARPGLVHGTVAEVGRHLAGLAGAGCSWAVCAPLDVSAPDAADRLAAARAAGTEDGPRAAVQ